MRITILIFSFLFFLHNPFSAQNEFTFSSRPESATFIHTIEAAKTIDSENFQKSQDNEFEGFEGFQFAPNCWTLIDADGDGYNWFKYDAEGSAYQGSNSAGSASWFNAALTPDNYLVSPQLTLGDNEELSYYVAAQDPYFYEEKYGVFISTTGNSEADFSTELFVETLNGEEWEERTVDLSAYSGMDVYIAFRHYDVSDQFVVKIDNVTLPGSYTTCSPVCLEPSSLAAEVLSDTEAYLSWDPVGSNYLLVYGPSGFDPDTAEAISLEDPFFSLQSLMPATDYDFYVLNNCMEDSLISDWVMDSFTTEFATEGQGFESFLFPPLCWTIIDADGDGNTWYHTEEDPFAGIFAAASASWTSSTGSLEPDNYLVSPQLSIATDEVLKYRVAAQNEYFNAEKYGVFISTSGNDEADFTEELFVETLNSEQWVERVIDLSAYDGMMIFIAFRHFDVTNESILKLDNVILSGDVINCITEVDELELNQFTIYPNPSSGQLFIQYKGETAKYKMEIFDSQGKHIYSKEQLLLTDQEHELNCHFLMKGLYLIRFSNSSNSFIKRIVIN